MKNKRKTLIWGLCALLGAFIVARVYFYLSKPEFEIRGSIAQSYTMVGGQRCRDTDISVIVYKNFNDPDLYKRVKEEHNRINGEPTKLTINLYKYSFENNEPYRIVVIDYLNNTEEIIE